MINQLFELCNDWMYEYGGCVNWDMKAYCWENGFYSRETTMEDENGNPVDWDLVITPEDIQDACDEVGIEVDCINF